MSPLSEPCQGVVVSALVTRRRELQAMVKYWREEAERSGTEWDCAKEYREASEKLQGTEAAILELDRRAVPWLHCHPDCSDLFAPKAQAEAKELTEAEQ